MYPTQSRRSSDAGRTTTMSRRSSFIGGANRSITDSNRLPIAPSSLSAQQMQLSTSSTTSSSHQQQQQQQAQQKTKEQSAEEGAALAAYDAILQDLGISGGAAKGGTAIGVDGLHTYLARFGLLSREALQDDLRVTAPPEKDLLSPTASSKTTLRSPGSPGSPASAAAAAGSVAKNDFVDFLCGHHEFGGGPNGNNKRGSMMTRERRDSGTGWIDAAIERHNQKHGLKRRGGGGGGGASGSPLGGGGMMMDSKSGGGDGGARVTQVSIDESHEGGPHHHHNHRGLEMMDTMGGGGGGSDDGEGGEGGGGPNHLDTLASIEARLRAALDARANTPVPPSLRLGHEGNSNNNSPASGGSPSSNRAGSSSPIGAGRRRGGGYMNSVSVPATRGYSPNVSRASTRGRSTPQPHHHHHQGGGVGGGGSGDSPASPSAILRRHQQAQLEALMAVRRSGGRLLQQRSAKRNPGTMAGFTVVRPGK